MYSVTPPAAMFSSHNALLATSAAAILERGLIFAGNDEHFSACRRFIASVGHHSTFSENMENSVMCRSFLALFNLQYVLRTFISFVCDGSGVSFVYIHYH